MSTPTAERIEQLVTTFTASAEHARSAQTPLQLLKSLRREINDNVVRGLMMLDERNWVTLAVLDKAAKTFVSSDEESSKAARRNMKRINKTGKAIAHEVQVLQRKFDALPERSPERIAVNKALGYRLAELELLERQLTMDLGMVTASHAQIEQMMPHVADLQHRIEALQGKFRGTSLRLTGTVILAVIIGGLPIAISLCTTITLDRVKRWIERTIKQWSATDYHDLILLAAFTLQLRLLTPVPTTLTTRLCWRTLDHAIDALRALSPQVANVETGLLEAEHDVTRVFSNSTNA